MKVEHQVHQSQGLLHTATECHYVLQNTIPTVSEGQGAAAAHILSPNGSAAVCNSSKACSLVGSSDARGHRYQVCAV